MHESLICFYFISKFTNIIALRAIFSNCDENAVSADVCDVDYT